MDGYIFKTTRFIILHYELLKGLYSGYFSLPNFEIKIAVPKGRQFLLAMKFPGFHLAPALRKQYP